MKLLLRHFFRLGRCLPSPSRWQVPRLEPIMCDIIYNRGSKEWWEKLGQNHRLDDDCPPASCKHLDEGDCCRIAYFWFDQCFQPIAKFAQFHLGVKSKPGHGLFIFIRNRILSFGMVLAIGFLLLVSLALSTVMAAFTASLDSVLKGGHFVAGTVDISVSFGVITLLFAMIFKFLPDVKIPWNKVWFGAIGTSILFTLGKYLLGLYLGRESTASAYGAAGSVLVLLMWVYYASLILLFGAEITQVHAEKSGLEVKSTEYAIPVTQEPVPPKAVGCR